MRNELKKQLTLMNAKEVVGWIVEHPGLFNLVCKSSRPPYMQNALEKACDALPEGRAKRALDYVRRHEGAFLFFGGSDAVGPALRKAYTLMTNED